jgi:hypothetical protein
MLDDYGAHVHTPPVSAVREARDRLPDLTTRTAVVILIETGLRSVDCLRLPLDPISTDEAGAPYLRFLGSRRSATARGPRWMGCRRVSGPATALERAISLGLGISVLDERGGRSR